MNGADKAAVIAAIQRLAEMNGGVPIGKERFIAETGFSDYLFQGRLWATWNDAVREAGFEPNAFGLPRLDEDDLLAQLAELTRKLGRFPTKAHIRLECSVNPALASATTFGMRLGPRAQQIARLREYLALKPEYAEVMAMLPPAATVDSVPDADDVDEPDLTQPVPGYVYLIRSAKHHKIGRSNDHGRRAYEIGLQLPEKLEVVHTIDDAMGIERYWH